MFNLGFSELLLLGLIALIFIGPNQLPEVARTLGRLLNEWKRATSDFQNTMTAHVTEDVTKRWQETRAHHPEEDFATHIQPTDIPTNHDIAVLVEHETPATTELPPGAEPVGKKHES